MLYTITGVTCVWRGRAGDFTGVCEVSLDQSNWSQIAEYRGNVSKDGAFAFDGKSANTRFVRVRVTQCQGDVTFEKITVMGFPQPIPKAEGVRAPHHTVQHDTTTAVPVLIPAD
jgi:hypothetical protein